MPIDDRSPNRSYKLPAFANFLSDDVQRLRDALNAIDADIFARYTKTEVDTLISNLIQGSPGALDTLNELAAAMGDDPNFAATVTNSLALKANIADVYSKAQADARFVQGQTQAEMSFIATANQTVFTLSTPVINKPSALVTIDGVVQPTSEYSLNQAGTELTLSEGVPAGTKVRVLALGVASQNAPADDSVTTPKLRDAAVTPSKLAEPLTRSAEITAAGTAVDFTGIPDWAKRITAVLNQVSTNGASRVIIRIGANTVETSNYISVCSLHSSDFVEASGFLVSQNDQPLDRRVGSVTLHRCGAYTWVLSGAVGTAAGNVSIVSGSRQLSAALNRLQITTLGGSDLFDSGTITLFYE